MLLEQPVRRPPVFEILRQAHEMSGTKPAVDYVSLPERVVSDVQPMPSRSFASPNIPQSKPTKTNSTNLLDFTSPTSSISSTPAMQPSLATTIQPQRRGRPTAGRAPSDINVQQPMPVPPSVPQAQPPQPSAPQQNTKLQITGEKPDAVETHGSVDAFGMPSKGPPPLKSASGFSDAFGVPGQAFGNRTKPSPGFSDSFGTKVRTGSSPKKSAFGHPPRPSASTQNSFSAFDLPRTTSPMATTTARKSPTPSSSIPQGEVTFETRFPSIETLSSGDAFSPPLEAMPSRSGSNQPKLISPITSPPSLNSRPSVMGSLTGGDYSNNHLSAPGRAGPLPRSTHVTGTAFSTNQGGLLSPDSVLSTAAIPTSSSIGRNNRDYFEGVEAQPLVSPSASSLALSPGGPIDLMTGEGETMGGRLLPSRSASSSGDRPPLPRSASSTGSARIPPSTGHNRPLLPEIDARKPTSNIDSESWSPLERLKQSQQGQPKLQRLKSDSSSEEDGPENPSGTNQRPASPRRRGSATDGITRRMSAFENQREDPPRKPSVSPTKPATFAKPTSVGLSASRSENLRSSESKRPVSMYNMASSMSASRSSVVSPSASLSASTSSNLPAPSDRPRHVRKGSINDIVSKYETLQSPIAPSLANKEIKKPSVAAKPTTLRKHTLDVSPQAVEKPAKPVKPTKPDLVRPTAVKHGEAPQALSWSKSSSGRAFPTTTNKPALATSTSNVPVEPRQTSPRKVATPMSASSEKTAVTSASGKSSPDKQQSVNSLIARWNQGNVNDKKPATQKGGYI